MRGDRADAFGGRVRHGCGRGWDEGPRQVSQISRLSTIPQMCYLPERTEDPHHGLKEGTGWVTRRIFGSSSAR